MRSFASGRPPRWGEEALFRSRNRTELKEHRKGFRAVAKLAGAGLERYETELLIEGDCIRLGVDDDAYTAELVRHSVSEREDGLEEGRPDAASSGRVFGCQSREAQDRQRIARETLSLSLGNAVGRYLRRSDRGEAEDPSVVDRYVGGADVVPKLVLSGESLEEAIEVDVSRAEPRPIIVCS